MNKVYLLIEEDADPYCGYYVKGVFSTKEKAEQAKEIDYQEILEFELDKNE